MAKERNNEDVKYIYASTTKHASKKVAETRSSWSELNMNSYYEYFSL